MRPGKAQCRRGGTQENPQMCGRDCSVNSRSEIAAKCNDKLRIAGLHLRSDEISASNNVCLLLVTRLLFVEGGKADGERGEKSLARKRKRKSRGEGDDGIAGDEEKARGRGRVRKVETRKEGEGGENGERGARQGRRFFSAFPRLLIRPPSTLHRSLSRRQIAYKH